MRTLSLSLLAASIAIIPSAAFAQPGPPPGHNWQSGNSNMVVRHGGPRAGHPGRDFRHRRLQRGFVINPFWFGPQFHVNNWQMYGFADPGSDRRWVRYYDDAYMIDRGGRVLDTRYGMDWDQYGEEWDVDDGIPAYRGSRDWRPGDEDYAWVEGQSGPDAQGYAGGRGHGGYAHGGGHPGGPMPGPGHGYGGTYGGSGYGAGHGYGAGYGYGFYSPGMVIIETTTTEAASYEEVIEEVVEVRQRARRAHRPRRARPSCACPAPVRRPPPGERG